MSQASAYTLRNTKLISTVVLIGSYLVVAAISLLLAIYGGSDAFNSLVVCGLALLYLAAAQLLAHRNHDHATAYMLVAFFGLLATGIVLSWGINTPIGTLLFALVIVLAGILLTARHALFAAIAAGLILAGVQTAIVFSWYQPNMSWSGKVSSFGDVLGYCVVFGMLALASWLYNREMERSLAQAQRAEAALLRQKDTLKMRIEQRTDELRKVQMEEMQHMYRFAELGQLGVTLLHDLANHLTALILEVDGIQSKEHAENVTRAREIIHYLEDIVNKTRERLHGNVESQTFNIVRKTSEAVTFLDYKAAKSGVTIDWQPPKRSWVYTGDPASYCQIIAVIANNAIDAYAPPLNKSTLATPRKVSIKMERDTAHITIKISDWGGGIAKGEREHLFKPYHSTKKSGLGLGLYIAKQTVEMQFSGTIAISSQKDNTEFIIKLPLKNGK